MLFTSDNIKISTIQTSMRPNTTTKPNTKRITEIINQRFNQEEQELNLNNFSFDWRSVLESRSWAALRILNLGDCKIDDFGAELVGNLQWPNLRSLHITENKITPAGVNKLLTKKFPKLEQLHLTGNKIADEGMQVLLKSGQHLPHLRLLIVVNNNFGAAGMIYMPGSKMYEMKELYLNGNNIGSGTKMLNKAEFPLLQQLWLSGCKIGDEGTKQLAKGHWPHLSNLQLSGNKIQQDGFTVLATCSFRRLRKITASWSSTDKTDAVAALNLVAAKCPYPSKVECYFDFKLKKEINRILLSRFIQKEVE